MAAYNDDDGDTVERNYTVSNSILDLAYNYLEEALKIFGTPSGEIPKLIEMFIDCFELFQHQMEAKFQLWYDSNWNHIVESNVQCFIEVVSHYL